MRTPNAARDMLDQIRVGETMGIVAQLAMLDYLGQMDEFHVRALEAGVRRFVVVVLFFREVTLVQEFTFELVPLGSKSADTAQVPCDSHRGGGAHEEQGLRTCDAGQCNAGEPACRRHPLVGRSN